MALVKSLITNTVEGNQRKVVWLVTPDAAATAFATGLGNIVYSQVTIKSGVTDATMGVFSNNQDVSGTATKGTIAMTSVVTSGEIQYQVVAYGS